MSETISKATSKSLADALTQKPVASFGSKSVVVGSYFIQLAIDLPRFRSTLVPLKNICSRK